MRILLPIVTLGLVSCMSPQDVRNSDPIQSGEFAADYRELAECTAHELSGQYSITHSIRDADRAATITHTPPNALYRYGGFEISVLQTGPRKVAVEFRERQTPFGDSADEIWPVIESCADA